ncbi:MAG TPA: DUF2252 domain-containing protein [Candidatus Nanopelagicales bacterium]
MGKKSGGDRKKVRAASVENSSAPRWGVDREGATEHWELGRAARDRMPREQLGAWEPAADRRDPVDILVGQEHSRVPELVPLRHERMAVSPFTFYRGAAAIMAEDLGTRPNTGLIAQLAGDAHLANFGGFASAERNLVFDLNDFDETLPGPFEWDVKRLVASFEIAGRHNGFTPAQRRTVVGLVASTYASAMSGFSRMGRLEVWYARIEAGEIIQRWGSTVEPARVERFRRLMDKGRTKTSARAVSRYTRVAANGELAIVSQPPFVVPAHELTGMPEELIREFSERVFASYRTTLSDDRQLLLSGYRIVDVARKVVGVGSVGTRCWIVLLVAKDDPSDDLVLQLKEAAPSVLASVTEPSRYDQHGQRVVEGQRLMQAASDPLLGWTRATGLDGVDRDFYVRQMWDWKTSADLDRMDDIGMGMYARMCGWTLARAHARSSDRHAIAAYIGGGGAFGRAMEEFAVTYADQNERDYAAFVAAIDEGRIEQSHLEGGGASRSVTEEGIA